MFKEIIKKLIEEIKGSVPNIEEIYSKYIKCESAKKLLATKNAEIDRINNEINRTKEQLNSFSAVDKMFRRKSYLKLKDELNSNISKLKELQNEISNLQKKIINFDEQINTILYYQNLIKLQNLFIEGAFFSNEFSELFYQIFNCDFNNVIGFFKKNDILMDFSNEVDYQLLRNLLLKRDNIEHKSKIESLDNIVLVRKTVVMPHEDKVIAPLYDPSATEERKYNISVDGKEIPVTVTVPISPRHTIHWCLNREVLGNSGGNWDSKDVIILQPMTEELYNSASNLLPIDAWFRREMTLDNYIVICDSLEKAKEFKQTNKKGIVLVVPKGKVNGVGNAVLGATGSYPQFKEYGGHMDGNYQMSDYFTRDFISQYPAFLKGKMHSYSEDEALDIFSKNLPLFKNKLNTVMGGLSKDKVNIIQAYKSITSSSLSLGIFDPRIVKETKILLEFLPEDLKEFSSFFIDFMEQFDSETFDPDKIFERMLKSIDITQENQETLSYAKKILIEEALHYNSIISDEKDNLKEADLRSKF